MVKEPCIHILFAFLGQSTLLARMWILKVVNYAFPPDFRDLESGVIMG